MDVRAKQRLCYRRCLFNSNLRVAVSPHVISIVRRFLISIMALNFLHMIKQLISITFVLVFVLSAFVTAQTVNEDRIAFTTSDAPWLVSLDSKNLDIQDQQIKHDNKSGYFLLTNPKEGFTVSLFIEPVVKCKTSAECRDFVLKTGNPEWGKVQSRPI